MRPTTITPLSLTLLLILGAVANAQDGTHAPCDQRVGVGRFICQSNAALVQAMNPTLDLPRCSESQKPTRVHPGHLPARAVFVTCSSGNLKTCSNVIPALMRAHSGVTINIVVSSSDLGNTETQAMLQAVQQSADKTAALFNVIPVASAPAGYARDPAIPRTNGDLSVASLLPDTMGGSRAFAEAIRQCRDVHVEEAFRHVEGMSDREATEVRRRYSNIGPDRETPPAGHQAEGGNVIALPDGTILYGNSKLATLAEHFRAGLAPQSTIEVQLPRVGVGHIDEFFNVVPAKNRCGYTILTASPRLLSQWANGPGSSLPAIAIEDQEKRNREQAQQLEDEYSQARKVINAGLANHLEPTAEQVQRLVALKRSLAKAEGEREFSWGEVSARAHFVKGWNEQQDAIDRAREVIWKKLSLSAKCSEEEAFTDVPMGWNAQGYALIPNPVNGVPLGGNYLMSNLHTKTQSDFEPEQIKDRIYVTRKRQIKPAVELEKYTREIIQSKTGLKVTGVDTSQTDMATEGKPGYLHCLTWTMPLPCVP